MSDYFVDSNTGDDANDGLSWGTAKETLQGVLDIPPSLLSVISVRGNHTVSTSLTVTNGQCQLVSDDGGTITCSGVKLFDSTQLYVEGFTLTGSTDYWCNAASLHNCTVNGTARAFPAYGYIWVDCCDINAPVYLSYGMFTSCKFTDDFESGNNGYMSLVRCRFDDSDVLLATRFNVSGCTFNNCPDVGFARPDLGAISDSVFRHDTSGSYPRHDSGFSTMFAQFGANYGYNVTIPGTVSGASLTALASDPYPSHGSGDWTPSSELQGYAADNVTPGSEQAGASGGANPVITLLQSSAIPGV